jgi:hypothetical protein
MIGPVIDAPRMILTVVGTTQMQNPRPFKFVNNRQAFAFFVFVIIVVSAYMAWHQFSLNPAEKQLLGHWTFRTIDGTNVLRTVEFRPDRRAILVDAVGTPGLSPSWYLWHVDGETLVLRYDDYDPDEPLGRKVRRGMAALWNPQSGGTVASDAPEKFRIVTKSSHSVELQSYSETGDVRPHLSLERVPQDNSD